MIPSRRQVIRYASATAAAALSTGSLPLESTSAAARQRSARPTLVAVYLRGGIDTLSTVVPYADKDYARHRPSLALAAPGSGPKAILPLDDHFGFNPNMKPLHALYEQGMCVPIVDVGSHHPTRSHFDAQDFMERAAPGLKYVTTGWLNRYLQATRSSQDANLRAVALQPLLPRSLRGPYPVLAKPDQNAEQAMAIYAQMYAPQRASGSRRRAGPNMGQETKRAIEEFGAKTIEQLWELTRILEYPMPATVQYPNSSFGRQMRDIAKLIKSQCGLEVTAVDYGGWDHHINVGPVEGQLGKGLADVSAAIGAFAADLGPEQLRKTLVLVMSEFGRTVKENANRGTDHGHGGMMLVIGGNLKGGKVYGEWTSLDESQLYERRDLPVHTDFRLVFAEVLYGLFGFDGLKRRMFEGFDHQDRFLGFLA